MQKLHHICIVALSSLLLVMLAACNEKKDPNEFGGEDVPYDETTSDRSYLEETATTFLNYFKPNEQSTALRVLSTFIEICDTYTFPDNFSDSRPDVSRAASSLLTSVSDGDYLSLSRAATAFVYNLARFQGLYQANSDLKQWQFIESRDHLNMRFWVDNVEYNLTVKGLGGSWAESITIDGSQYDVEIPKDLTLTLYSGTINAYTTHMSVSLKSEAKNNDRLNASTIVTFANIRLESTTKATNTSVQEDYILYIDNPSTYVRYTLASGQVQLSGSSLCSVQAWQKVAEGTGMSTQLNGMIDSGSSVIMIVNKVQIKSQFSAIGTILDNAHGYWTSSNTSDPKARAMSAAKALQGAITANMYYPGKKDTVRGTLGWEAYQSYEDPAYQEWSVRPTLTLTADNRTYDFESYFGNSRFLSIEKQYSSLIEKYRFYWR